MIIKNFKELATSKERKIALEIISAGIESVLAQKVIKEKVKFESNTLIINNDKFPIKGNVYVIGGGKASGGMAEVVEEILGNKIKEGYINHKGGIFDTKKIQLIRGGHPTPTIEAMRGVEKMLSIKNKLKPNDVIICLISGGGSALLPMPAEGVDFIDLEETTKRLVESGAKIQEINKVRTHLSRIKGGRLAEHFIPNTVITLILSDVVGDDIQSIASGPTTYDESTFTQAYNILAQYGTLYKIPDKVKAYIEKGIKGDIKETPKVMPPNSRPYVLASNKDSIKAMELKAKELKIPFKVLTMDEERETNEAAEEWAEDILAENKRPFVYIIGGETRTTPPENHGLGGRNLHYTARSLLTLKEMKGKWAVAAVATDGNEFNTGFAGGIIDNNTLKNAEKLQLNPEEYLKRYDSLRFLQKLNSVINVGGSSGTNVGDIIIYVLG
jgi:glycerate-2-kinase